MPAAINPGSVVTVGTTKTVLSAERSERWYLCVQNPSGSGATVSLSLGGTPVSGGGIVLSPGMGWEAPQGYYDGEVSAVASTGTVAVSVTEV